MPHNLSICLLPILLLKYATCLALFPDAPHSISLIQASLTLAQGSAVQLPSYNLSKSLLVDNGWKPNSYLTYFAASAVSGLCVLTAMQPADTVLTRMYNRERHRYS